MLYVVIWKYATAENDINDISRTFQVQKYMISVPSVHISVLSTEDSNYVYYDNDHSFSIN